MTATVLILAEAALDYCAILWKPWPFCSCSSSYNDGNNNSVNCSTLNSRLRLATSCEPFRGWRWGGGTLWRGVVPSPFASSTGDPQQLPFDFENKILLPFFPISSSLRTLSTGSSLPAPYEALNSFSTFHPPVVRLRPMSVRIKMKCVRGALALPSDMPTGVLLPSLHDAFHPNPHSAGPTHTRTPNHHHGIDATVIARPCVSCTL
ncbi:hypothetical protein ZHAS_00018995 [Anopheles sinensis]|uniref:Uncharacterized protein n=1 Tax=Anopheles sinensis TaxID=74873 RepID=A0A084WL60_ANOSI|nr:hypothetical protein ZHAS_00018995 [Anopheles sinensis]